MRHDNVERLFKRDRLSTHEEHTALERIRREILTGYEEYLQSCSVLSDGEVKRSAMDALLLYLIQKGIIE